jgi:hypothetical protein
MATLKKDTLMSSKKIIKGWKPKPTSAREGLPAEANRILKQIQNAQYYKDNKKLNKKLNILKQLRPDLSEQINTVFKKQKVKSYEMSKLTIEEKRWAGLL